jgi:hypothetical protein
MMKNFKRVLLMAALLCSVSFGVLANDQKRDNPPPKESKPKVVNADKKDRPQGNNSNRGNDQKKDDKKKP